MLTESATYHDSHRRTGKVGSYHETLRESSVDKDERKNKAAGISLDEFACGFTPHESIMYC